MRVKVLWVGKTRNPHLGALCAYYLDRIRHLTRCDVVELRDATRARRLTGDALRKAEAAEIERAISPSGRVVALDVAGRQFGSEEFACFFAAEQAAGVREIVFLIGGVEGLDETIRRRT